MTQLKNTLYFPKFGFDLASTLFDSKVSEDEIFQFY